MQLTREGLIPLPPLKHKDGSLYPVEKSLLGHLILLVRPRVIVELGVDQAITTEFMCEVLIDNQIAGVVVGFDLPEIISSIRESNERISHLETTGRALLIPGSLPESLDTWLRHSDKEIDMALVDATHNYPSVLGELKLLWPRLSPDGYIVCDDYYGRRDGVRYAVDHFIGTHRGAMAVPLVPSRRSEEVGLHAKLVVLRRRPYHYSYRHLMQHHWLVAKARLYSYSFVRMMWNVVRPLFRRDSE